MSYTHSVHLVLVSVLAVVVAVVDVVVVGYAAPRRAAVFPCFCVVASC